MLDDVLRRLVDDERSVAEVITDVDHEPAIVHRIARMLDLAQFKREQAAVIPKTTPRAFGRGRPWPIVSRDGSRIQEQAARPSPDPSL